MYSIKELSSIVNKTPQALYQLIKQNQDLSTLLKEHSIKKGRSIKYDEEILKWLLDYYEVSTDWGVPTDNESASEAVIPEDTAPGIERLIEENKALQGKIELLTAENDMLRSQLAEKTALWREDRDNLGQALLLLNQERETVKLLLPAPRVPFTEKLKNLFKKKDG